MTSRKVAVNRLAGLLIGAALSAPPAAANPVDTAKSERGKYLATITGCQDCHSPKTFGPQGPEPDPARAYSGHPGGGKLPEVPGGLIGPQAWGAVCTPDLTAWVGPWGTSFATNLTPDPESGIGTWTEAMFVKAMRTGKHMGEGRPILPPMPWQYLGAMTDADISALFAYLRSLKPVHNIVPDPRPPAGAAAGHEHHHKPAQGATGHDATVRHPFDDVERWVKVFDDPARDAWQKPKELVTALGLGPGQKAADIGAGTGYFARWLASAVGETGAVYAVDVEPALVEHIRKRVEAERLGNVIPVLGSFDNPRLAPGSIDLALIVDTYHHIDDRLGYFRRLASSLRPGGRVVVVDFHKRELPVGPPLEHKLARETVVEEMTAAGYRLRQDLDLLPHQYFLVFGR